MAVVMLLVAGCADLTAPVSQRERERAAQGATPVETPSSEAPSAALRPGALPPRARAANQRARQVAAEAPEVRMSQVLIAHAGAAQATTKRSKGEAKRLAKSVRARALGGANFADLAKKYSDHAPSKDKGGDLGSFSKDKVAEPFSSVVFKLEPGEISEVVESPFGFHVIRRDE